MASATPLAALNRRFEIPGIVKVVEERAGFPSVHVQTPDVSGQVQLYGAHVTSWKPAGEEEVLFVSAKTKWHTGTAIRGGVPVCFPWFADRSEGPKSPPHGMVRTKPWKLEGITHADSNVTVALSTSADEETQKEWQGNFHLLFCATFGEQLRLELIVTNHGSLSFRFEEALHTYYRVGNVEKVKVRGLNGVAFIDKTDGRKEKHQRGELMLTGEADRVYKGTSSAVEIEDPVLRRRILVSKEDSRDTVVWNPWSQKAAATPDLGADEWRQFVCVETANVAEHGVTLGEAQAHTMSALVSLNAF
jgi:glucose-6-phosphate 1-epimerase